MLWEQKEQWSFSTGRGEKGHIESKFVIILIKEIICKDLNLYFLISLFLSPQVLTHMLHPLAACQKSASIYYFVFYKKCILIPTASALLINWLMNGHYIQCHQCKGYHVNLAGPWSMGFCCTGFGLMESFPLLNLWGESVPILHVSSWKRHIYPLGTLTQQNNMLCNHWQWTKRHLWYEIQSSGTSPKCLLKCGNAVTGKTKFGPSRCNIEIRPRGEEELWVE